MASISFALQTRIPSLPVLTSDGLTTDELVIDEPVTDEVAVLGPVRRAEALGFTSIRQPDHPGSYANPMIGLAAVAQVTSTVSVGPYVLNAGLRHPLDIAVEALTLDVVSGGRALLGLGAGHTPSEWEMRGLTRPSPRKRIDRLLECLDVLPALLAGESVTFRGEHVELVDAQVENPAAVQDRIPILLGGNNPRLLCAAGAQADIVGLTGLGKTLPDGHNHTVRWRAADIDRHIELVAEGAGGRSPVIEALVQAVVITDDAEKAAETIAADVDGADGDDLLACPYIFLGTAAEIAVELDRHDERWGITSFCIRPAMLDAIEAVLAVRKAAVGSSD